MKKNIYNTQKYMIYKIFYLYLPPLPTRVYFVPRVPLVHAFPSPSPVFPARRANSNTPYCTSVLPSSSPRWHHVPERFSVVCVCDAPFSRYDAIPYDWVSSCHVSPSSHSQKHQQVSSMTYETLENNRVDMKRRPTIEPGVHNDTCPTPY